MRPIKNQAYTFDLPGLHSQTVSGFVTDPTLAAGDVQISKDGAAFANTDSLPTVLAGTTVVSVALTAAEMNCDRLTVRFVDAAGDQWHEAFAAIQTETASNGDATAANQTTIISLLNAGATIQSPVPSSTVIELIYHDSYDGTFSPKLLWTVAKDYTGKTIKLLIYSKGDATDLVKEADGVVDSATEVSVSMDAEFTTDPTFTGCPLSAQYGFALVATDGIDSETIARGACYVYARSEAS